MASERKSTDAFEAALKREFQSAPSSDGSDCPAPDLLAAYYDRSLSRNERTRIDSHLVTCARCQSMVAAIVRADDTEPSAVQPQSARGIFWITRLLAPVAVVGVIIAIAIGVRTREQRAPELIALASRDRSSKLGATELAPAPAEIESQARPAPQVPSAPAAGRGLQAGKADLLMRKEQIARAMRGPNAAAGSAVSGTTALMAEAPLTNQIASPDGSVVWRFGMGGAIMRAGNSSPWLALHSGVTSDLLAAEAPSNDVCWMVGKSGTIVRTLDGGAHWQILKAPARSDFTAVSATDSNNATAIAAGGARFTTHDGGVTWSSP